MSQEQLDAITDVENQTNDYMDQLKASFLHQSKFCGRAASG